jgi:hypothetical protein
MSQQKLTIEYVGLKLSGREQLTHKATMIESDCHCPKLRQQDGVGGRGQRRLLRGMPILLRELPVQFSSCRRRRGEYAL